MAHHRAHGALALFSARTWLALAAAGVLAGACTPTVNLQTQEPIRIQLDINITQEVRVKLDREVEDLIADNPDLF